MTQVLVCDNCGDRLGEFGLRIEPINGHDAQSTVFFFDGGWNGGEFCGPACASAALEKVAELRT